MSASARLSATPEAGRERRWFVAEDVRLAIDCPVRGEEPAGVAALRDALLLEEHAPLLDCLVDWSGHDADWCPIADAGNGRDADRSGDDTLDATLASDVGGARRIGLSVPDGWREALGPLPPAWSAFVVCRWHRLEARLVLDRFALGSEDVAHWGAGSVVLLPASFGERSRPTLEPPADTAPTASVIVEPGSETARTHAETDESVVAGVIGCEVALLETFEVAAEEVGGGSSADLPAAARAAADEAEGRRCRVRREDGVEAEGTLVCLGSGLAAVLDGGEFPLDGERDGARRTPASAEERRAAADGVA